MNQKPKVPPGQLRLSQLITTYGPGAPVDLPRHSVLVGGLESWEPQGAMIREPRLVAKIQRLFPELPQLQLYAPPGANEDGREQNGVGTWLFPEWFLTVEPKLSGDGRVRSRRLVHRSVLTDRRFIDEDRKRLEVVPVRFVRACVRGHIADIAWYDFIHGAQDPCKRPLWMDERGTSGDLAEVAVRCECGKLRLIMDATVPGKPILGWCEGQRPWLGAHAREHCDQVFRLLIRTASNAYFGQVMSVISLPDRSEVVQRAMDPLWEDYLQYTESKDELIKDRARKEKLRTALPEFDDDTIWEAIQTRRAGAAPERTVKQAEFEVLATSQQEIGEDRPEGDFYARALPPDKLLGRHMATLERVVLVHRLREVQALLGFTRFESMAPTTDGELDAGVTRAALAREPRWFPAVETRGEGIFLHFRKKAVRAWARTAAVQTRARALLEGFEAWKREHAQSKRQFCGVEYLMLHSLSHLLITAVSLGCGYASCSVRERVYALEQGYGILLYTSSSDAEGTLGGLVEVGRRIGEYLDDALEMGRLCSNDPVCAQHNATDSHEQRFLLGAACHGCLLISETSCEQRNDFLDRALVVSTVDAVGADFFAS